MASLQMSIHLRSNLVDIGINSTYWTMNNSFCSSCQIQADKSAYWTPLLYYWNDNGTFTEVPHSGSVVYYLGRGPGSNNLTTFPPGLKMLSGSQATRAYDNTTMTWGNATYPGRPIADRVSFACLTEGAEPPNQPYMYNATQCINGMRAQITFQSCWNGVDLYKTDNSHVAYLSQIDNGVCPPGYPYQFPTIFLETDYAPSQVAGAHNDSRFVFAQGDPTGFGFHADFLNGWNITALTEAIDQCIINNQLESGVVDYCPPLEIYNTDGAGTICPPRAPEINETVTGTLDKLPGCITVVYGPDSATSADTTCNSSVVRPAVFHTVDTVSEPTLYPTAGQAFGDENNVYVGCFNDSASGIRTLNALSTTNYSVMTIEWCQEYCARNGYRLSGTEYTQECHCDNELNPTAVNNIDTPYAVGVTNNNVSSSCTWNCGGTLTDGGVQELCGGYGYISVYNNTNATYYGLPFNGTGYSAGNAEGYEPAAPFASNYIGCYTDYQRGSSGAYTRLLNAKDVDWQNMTIEICAEYCTGSNATYHYYGLEYSTQCWCGNTLALPNYLLNETTSPTNSSACSDRCLGNETEICGGSNALSVYNFTSYVAPSYTPAEGGKYGHVGCLLDPNNAGGRALQPGAMTNAHMTVDICIKYCLGKYYHYAGLEYGDECYCGNDAPAPGSSGQLTTCNVSQQMLCPGNGQEYCGGSGFMSLYYSTVLKARDAELSDGVEVGEARMDSEVIVGGLVLVDSESAN
ncbi:hypothetical protein Tdes44962_MAKER05870 [Teratosphaeria destructans]|uniref:WSC domain-containing protein n=1 Tax=Teratosphaeria destructans TaxID=418781 RepID=A0A9W7VYK0_9PEZI|nr:hypothetical protein Tdes44962_MAKER05870 [Teratosphaeria destructans]